MAIDDRTRKQIEYALYRTFMENPRVTIKELSRVVAKMRNWKQLHPSARQIIDRPFKNHILVGPYLYCNSGIQVTFDREEKQEKKEEGTGVPLVGNYSYVLFSRENKGNLEYAELVRPSFPRKVTLEEGITADEKEFLDQCFVTPQKLKPDVKPLWDDTDWKVYHAMRNVRRNFFEVGKELQLSWKMVKERFQKVLKDCKVFMGFFPLGYRRYDHLLLTVTTDYETGMRKWLQGLDRSSWLFKVDDILIMYLFHSHINCTCLKLCEMAQMGIIRMVRVAFPVCVDEKFLLI